MIMIEHVTVTYETIDGLQFTDKNEAYRHENSLLYQQSGFRFYDKNRRVIKDIERCYDDCEYFTVDRSKEKEEGNKKFMGVALYYGWIFPENILTDHEAKRYRYDWDDHEWIPVSRKKNRKV